MIENYRALGIFVAVADAGSFSAAGRRLRLSTSVVSHHISKLEATLGVALLFRSTRALSLTSEGRQILDAARRMVAAGEEALDVLSDHSDQPVGTLKLTLPAFGATSSVHQRVWDFAKAHPMVSLSLHSSDQPVDLIGGGYDLGIRLGRLTDSTLRSRRIGTFRRKLVASPAYLRCRPAITRPDDVEACAVVSVVGLPDTMTLYRGQEEIALTPAPARVEVESITAGKAAVLAGLGVMRLPLNEIGPDLEDGQLVEVLPDWQLPELGVYAVWPDSGPRKMLTRRFIDFLAADREAA